MEFTLQVKGQTWRLLMAFYSHPIGQNLVMWLHLAARESGKCSLKLYSPVPS